MNESAHFETELQADFMRTANARLERLTAEQRVAWVFENLPGQHILSSSFGVQAAVMLHLVTRIVPQIPVVLIDTGYLFPETYAFVDQLSERLDLNLHVYRPQLTPAWLEARHGRLWENGVDGIEHYNHIHKVEPMQRCLQELDVGTWFTGLRRAQSRSRAELPVLTHRGTCFKFHPIIEWNERSVYRYLKQHDLPYHPLWEQGFTSIGDVHTSRRLEPGMLTEETRFFGLKRECGLHE